MELFCKLISLFITDILLFSKQIKQECKIKQIKQANTSLLSHSSFKEKEFQAELQRDIFLEQETLFQGF